MANGGRIDVYFHNAEGNGRSEEEIGQEVEIAAKKKSSNDIARSAVVTMAIGYGKKAASYVTGIFGDLTGDYIKQNQVENLINNAATGMMMAQFPVGTIAGAFSLATQTISYYINVDKQNRQTALLKERSGNETINNSEVE